MQMQVDTESQQQYYILTTNTSKGQFTSSGCSYDFASFWQPEMDRIPTSIPGMVCYTDEY
jgi:hypothetical protein